MGLMDRVFADPFLGLLWFFLVIEVLFIVPQIIFLLIRARQATVRDAETARFEEELGKGLLRSVHDPNARLAWMADAAEYPSEVVRAFLARYILSTSGDLRERLVEVYKEIGLLDEDLGQLRSVVWQRRMRGLRQLSVVATRDERDAILALRRDRPEIRMLAAHVIARIGDTEDVLDLMVGWDGVRRLEEHPLKKMLHAVPRPVFAELVASWDKLESPAVRRMVLEAAAQSDPTAAARWLPAAALDEDKEVRIGACIAAGRLRSKSAKEILIRLMVAPEWEVRAQAARSLGYLASADTAGILIQGMRDRSFWVRRNSSLALATMGDLGRASLQDAALTDEDRFARDAAREALGRLAVNGGGAA